MNLKEGERGEGRREKIAKALLGLHCITRILLNKLTRY